MLRLTPNNAPAKWLFPATLNGPSFFFWSAREAERSERGLVGPIEDIFPFEPGLINVPKLLMKYVDDKISICVLANAN